jgi:hypothetical protein
MWSVRGAEDSARNQLQRRHRRRDLRIQEGITNGGFVKNSVYQFATGRVAPRTSLIVATPPLQSAASMAPIYCRGFVAGVKFVD